MSRGSRPAPGAYTRTLRFGEWISEPVTPLFESWLLTAMEERLHALLKEWIGQRAPRPYHVVVNGWYFYSLNWLSAAALARSLPGILWHLVRSPRRVAGVLPADGSPQRPDLRARVARGPAAALPGGRRGRRRPRGDVAGHRAPGADRRAGRPRRRVLRLDRGARRRRVQDGDEPGPVLSSSPGPSSLGGSHLPLLAGFEPPADPAGTRSRRWTGGRRRCRHAATATRPAEDHARLVEARQAAETAAFEALASSPRRLRSFRRLLAETQHLVPVREEQVRELTIAWPVMRRAVAADRRGARRAAA